MATIIRTKRTLDAGKEPAAGSLALGELAVNVTDKKIWVGDNSGNPQELAGGAGGGATVHNDLTGRTVALCHPLAAVYDPNDGDKNLDTIIDEINTGKVSEAPNDGNPYARQSLGWVEIDLTMQATWGNITGTLSSQTDLVNEFNKYPEKEQSETINNSSGVWTFKGWNGYNYGIKCASSGGTGYLGAGNSGSYLPSIAMGTTSNRYVLINSQNSTLVSNGWVLGVNKDGDVIQPPGGGGAGSEAVNPKMRFLTNNGLINAMRAAAAQLPASLEAIAVDETSPGQGQNDPAMPPGQTKKIHRDILTTFIDALATVIANADYSTPSAVIDQDGGGPGHGPPTPVGNGNAGIP